MEELNTDESVRVLMETGKMNAEQALAATELIQMLMKNESD